MKAENNVTWIQYLGAFSVGSSFELDRLRRKKSKFIVLIAFISSIVVPAKAGIHLTSSKRNQGLLMLDVSVSCSITNPGGSKPPLPLLLPRPTQSRLTVSFLFYFHWRPYPYPQTRSWQSDIAMSYWVSFKANECNLIGNVVLSLIFNGANVSRYKQLGNCVENSNLPPVLIPSLHPVWQTGSSLHNSVLF